MPPSSTAASTVSFQQRVWGLQTLMQRTWQDPVAGEEKVAAGEEMESMVSDFLSRIRFKLLNDRVAFANELFETHVRYDEHCVSIDLRAKASAWRATLAPEREWMHAHAVSLLPKRSGQSSLLSRFKTIVALKAIRFLPSEMQTSAKEALFSLQVDYAAFEGRTAVLSAWVSNAALVAVSKAAHQALQEEALSPSNSSTPDSSASSLQESMGLGLGAAAPTQSVHDKSAHDRSQRPTVDTNDSPVPTALDAPSTRAPKSSGP